MRKIIAFLLFSLFSCVSVFGQATSGPGAQSAGGLGSSVPVPGSQISFGSTVSPLAYGAKWDAKYVYDITATSGSNTITCPDCTFTAFDQGHISYSQQTPMNSNQGTAQFIVLFSQGTICNNGLISSTSAKLCAPDGVTPNNAAANCTPTNIFPTAACTFAWGSADDTSPINQAMVAAWQTAGKCQAIEFPSGFAFISSQNLYTAPTSLSSACGGNGGTGSVSGIDLSQTGPEVWGQGPGNTQLLPLPNFNFASCTGGQNANTCIGGTNNMEAHDFGVNGLGQSVNSAHSVTLVTLQGGNITQAGCTGSTGFNLTLANWAVQSSGSVGLEIGNFACGDPTYFNIISELFGATNCKAIGSGLVMQMTGVACFGATVQNLLVLVSANTASGGGTSAGIVNSQGGFYGNLMSSGPSVSVQSGGPGTAGAGSIFRSSGDFINPLYPLAGATAVLVGAFSGGSAITVYLDHDAIGIPSGTTASSQVFFMRGTGPDVLHVRDSFVTATGTNNALLNEAVAATLFANDGGNTFVNGSVASTLTGKTTAAQSESGTVTCATSAATITFVGTYINNPFVVIQDQTTAGVVTQTSLSNTAKVVSCPGASDVLLYTVAPNVF